MPSQLNSWLSSISNGVFVSSCHMVSFQSPDVVHRPHNAPCAMSSSLMPHATL